MRQKGWFQSQIPDKRWNRDVHSSPLSTLSTFSNSHLLPLIPSPLRWSPGHLFSSYCLASVAVDRVFMNIPSFNWVISNEGSEKSQLNFLFISFHWKYIHRAENLVYIYIYTCVCFRLSWYLCVSLEITHTYYLCLRRTIYTSWIHVCIYL